MAARKPTAETVAKSEQTEPMLETVDNLVEKYMKGQVK